MNSIKSLFSKEGLKNLFLHHGEKIALTFAGVIVLAVLAGTNWVPYPKKPRELLDLVDKSYKRVQENYWPEDERQKFDTLREDNTLETINDRLAPTRKIHYEFPVTLYEDISGKSEPLQEPKFEPIQDLTVTSGYCILAQIKELAKPQESSTPASPTTTPDPFDGKNTDFIPQNSFTGVGNAGEGSEFGPPPGMGPGGMRPGMGPGGPGMRPGGSMGPGGMGPGGMRPGGMGPGGGMRPGGMGGSDSMYGSGEGYDPYAGMDMNGLTTSNMEPVALRYNAIRGIFPRREQIRNISDALHITEAEAEPFLDFLNFRLQRRTLEPGQTDWENAQWQDVDNKFAMDMVERAVNFEADSVFATITHPVFTMPLPARVLGFWGANATHPGVKEYELSEEDKKIETELNQQIIQNYKDVLEAEAKKPGRGGFSVYTNNLGAGMQQMGNDALGTSAQAKRLLNDLNKQFGGDKNMKEKILEHIKATSTSTLNPIPNTNIASNW